MTSDSAVLHSQSFAPVETIPHTDTVQEIHELNELLRLVDALPAEHRPALYQVLDRLTACVERRQRTLGYVHDSLNQMSLDLKYLIFDLEVTRRERDELRDMLDGF